MPNVKGGGRYQGMVTVAGGGMCFEEGWGQIDNRGMQLKGVRGRT